MLTQMDIKKIVGANKEVFATKEDILKVKDELINDFSDLQSAVDGFAKKADLYFQEMLVLAHRMDRMEKWIQTIADKVGVKLEF